MINELKEKINEGTMAFLKKIAALSSEDMFVGGRDEMHCFNALGQYINEPTEINLFAFLGAMCCCSVVAFKKASGDGTEIYEKEVNGNPCYYVVTIGGYISEKMDEICKGGYEMVPMYFKKVVDKAVKEGKDILINEGTHDVVLSSETMQDFYSFLDFFNGGVNSSMRSGINPTAKLVPMLKRLIDKQIRLEILDCNTVYAVIDDVVEENGEWYIVATQCVTGDKLKYSFDKIWRMTYLSLSEEERIEIEKKRYATSLNGEVVCVMKEDLKLTGEVLGSLLEDKMDVSALNSYVLRDRCAELLKEENASNFLSVVNCLKHSNLFCIFNEEREDGMLVLNDFVEVNGKIAVRLFCSPEDAFYNSSGKKKCKCVKGDDFLKELKGIDYIILYLDYSKLILSVEQVLFAMDKLEAYYKMVDKQLKKGIVAADLTDELLQLFEDEQVCVVVKGIEYCGRVKYVYFNRDSSCEAEIILIERELGEVKILKKEIDSIKSLRKRKYERAVYKRPTLRSRKCNEV